MSQHDLNKLDTTHLKFLQASECDLHLKVNDFICLTCEIELCTVCAVENHQLHEVHQLEIYVRIMNIFIYFCFDIITFLYNVL